MSPVADLRRYAAAAWKRRWPALLVAWVVAILGWVGVAALPDRYESSARIYADADAILGQTLRGIAVDGATAAQVETLQRTLLARPNLERVIARTDLGLRVTSERDREAMVAELTKNIRITPQARNLFRVEYTDSQPAIARAVVQTVLDLFMERVSGNDREQMQNARAFVNQQVTAYEAQLRDAERRRAEFRSRYVDLIPNETTGGASRFESARQRLNELRGELQDTEMRRDIIRRQVEQTPRTLPADVVARGGGNAGPLAAAEQELRQLQTRYTDQHPAIAMQRAIVADLRRSGGGAGGPVRGEPRPNPAFESLQTRLVDAEGDIASLRRRIAAETQEVERLEALARGAPQLLAQMTDLDRDYGILRRSYEELLQRRESLQIAGAARTGADQVRLDIIEPPTLPVAPTGPNRPLFAAGALVVALGAGAAVAVLLSLMDTSIYSLRELRDLGLPVLGAVSPARPKRRLLPTAAFAGALSLLFVCFAGVAAGGAEILRKVLA
ncbi:XrtA system polysaccharide chain length determinant [Sabulicella rubraurantiaca]|uniref:XrtA system polysaccharide chain length determinant n=1 Tax=Sabulicella rubraurantiaca TaxID=2811429 RepID=UPI001A967E59|nr:XrtA system polysaccharide chain length determinant [Sabulicella rubraurantiaca]